MNSTLESSNQSEAATIESQTAITEIMEDTRAEMGETRSSNTITRMLSIAHYMYVLLMISLLKVLDPRKMNTLESSNQSLAATIESQSTNMEIMEDTRVEIGETSSPLPNVEDESQDEEIRMYQAALKGDWDEAYECIRRQKEIVRKPITGKMETALHIAVAAKHKEFVRNLLGDEEMKPDDLVLTNKDGNTALCFAAASGDVEIADMLIKMKPELPNIPGSQKMRPIYMAALFGHGEMVRYLKRKTTIETLSNTDMRHLFLVIISADIYDVALWMFNKMGRNKKVLIHSPNGNQDETALHLMALKPSAISHKRQLNLFQKSANYIFKGFHKEKMGTLAHQLVDELWKSVVQLPAETISDILKSPSNSMLLFDAAKSGNVEFLIILIRSYPDLIWKVNELGQSLFHVAALNRHESIFKIIYELGGIKDLIAAYKDEKTENNLLHLVACLPPPNRLQVVSGAALQMQRELLWFKVVKEIVPRSYINTKNKEGYTAHDLFTKEHDSLRKEGEKWMKETATACMLVATLIATVVFAAAFTLPGGNDEKLPGFPVFRKEFWFDMFILSDSVALLSSVTAIVLFLGIMTSRYAEDDFRKALPTKLMLGLLALFVSVISMVLAFTAAMILIRQNKPKWSLILVICLASLTAISFTLLHFDLWLDILRSTYFSKFLFYGRKSGLFL